VSELALALIAAKEDAQRRLRRDRKLWNEGKYWEVGDVPSFHEGRIATLDWVLAWLEASGESSQEQEPVAGHVRQVGARRD